MKFGKSICTVCGVALLANGMHTQLDCMKTQIEAICTVAALHPPDRADELRVGDRDDER